MVEAGWGDGDPRTGIMQVREALRLCRYLAAFGMHTGGWSYAEAVEFFMREGYATRPVAELELARGWWGPRTPPTPWASTRSCPCAPGYGSAGARASR